MSLEGHFVAAVGPWLQVVSDIARLDGADIIRTTAGVTLAAEDAWPPQLIEVASDVTEPASDRLVITKDRPIVEIGGAETLRALEIGYFSTFPEASGRLCHFISVLFSTESNECYDTWVAGVPFIASDTALNLVRDGWEPDDAEYSLYHDGLLDLGEMTVTIDERPGMTSPGLAIVDRGGSFLLTLSDGIVRRWTRAEPSPRVGSGRFPGLEVYSAHFEVGDAGVYICVLNVDAGFSYLRLEAKGTEVWVRHYPQFASNRPEVEDAPGE